MRETGVKRGNGVLRWFFPSYTGNRTQQMARLPAGIGRESTGKFFFRHARPALATTKVSLFYSL